MSLEPQRIHALHELETAFNRLNNSDPDPRDLLPLLVSVEHVLRAFRGYRPTIGPDEGKEVG